MDVSSALKEIRKHRKLLSTQQMRTLKGQALSGNVDAAMRGLGKLINRTKMSGHLWREYQKIYH